MPALALHSEIARPEKKAKPSVPLPFEVIRLHLLADHVERASGQEARQRVQMLLDRAGVREQAVDRDQSRDRRKKGEQRVEGHAGRDRQDAVVLISS